MENQRLELPVVSTLHKELARLGKGWGWLFASGIGFVLLGIAAYLWPVASTVTLTLAMGWLLVIGGFVRIIQFFELRKYVGTGWRAFDALLSLAAGVLILRYPGGGMLAIAIAMIFFFFMSAVTQGSVALATRPLPGSGWAFMSAIVSFALGIYMIATFPISALWVPGLLLGIDFFVHGISLMGISARLRKMHHEMKPIERPIETRRAA